VFIALLAIAAMSGTAVAAFPGTPGRIVLAVKTPGPDIETVNPDGSDPQLLTHNSPLKCPCDGFPAWSPNGRQIAFARLVQDGGPFQIWVMNADGSDPHSVTSGPSDQDPAWSPVGSQIVFTSGAGTGDDQLAIVNADGTDIRKIGPVPAGAPSWSPDGSLIAFDYGHLTCCGGRPDIFTIHPDGTGLANLTNNTNDVNGITDCDDAAAFFPDWSPDGSKVVYSGNEFACGNPVVTVIASNGTGRTQLGQVIPPGPDHDAQLYPAWSPDGSQIVYAQIAFTSGDYELDVMNADGSDPHTIVSGVGEIDGTSWQPLPAVSPTSTVVSCSPGNVVAGESATCTVAVAYADGGMPSTPTGKVTFSSAPGPGSFTPGSCTLSGSRFSAICQVTYTPSATTNNPVRTDTITAGYGGDASHSASSRTTEETVISPAALTRGSFVIGDQNATVGNTVTFWGAKWSSLNSLSAGGVPSAFKGFATHTPNNPPNCGDRWIGEPGNSSQSPAMVPQYMALIASSSIIQSGSTISGEAAKVVVVKTNPDYAPDPSHPGTGTVVAIACGR
jgi:TolB protein